MKADKLYLVGFMGAGKSTTAAALGRRIGWRAEDIDTRIETREHRSVAAIFAHDGEAYFRTIERQVLHELLPERSVVVAAGGVPSLSRTIERSCSPTARSRGSISR